jgi:hypothetical protein
MTEPKLNIYQKLVEVRKSIGVFTKDTDSYGYSYVSGTQVLRKIQAKMDELQILLMPKVLNQSYSTFDYKDKKGNDKTDFIVTAEMNYVWVNAENPEETIEIPFPTFGQQDDISKAFGSGLTYSERYFLLKFFGIPTDGDDPDAKDTSGKSANKKNYSGGGGKQASEKQLNLVNSLLKKKINDQWSYDALYSNLKQKVGTTKEIEKWSVGEASKAIEILQGGKSA